MANVMANDPFYKAQGYMSSENKRVAAQGAAAPANAHTDATAEVVEKGPDA